MKKKANFGNTIAEILTKSMREERETKWWLEWEKILNFINEVTEIPAAQMKCLKERSARKEKSNCGNQVVENGRKKKNYGNQVAKIVGEEREF